MPRALPSPRDAFGRLVRALGGRAAATGLGRRRGGRLRLLLHIGTEKTGSTSLQYWCVVNAAALREHGIWYADAQGRPDHRGIAVYPKDMSEPDDGFWELGLRSPADLARFREGLARRLAEEVAAARARGCSTFVISSEHLHSRMITTDEVGRLKGLLAPLFDEVTVVAFIRPQIDLAVSRLSVAAREGALRPDLLDVFVRLNRPYFDYHAMWQRWTAHFARVEFLAFDRNPDVIERLCEILAVDKDAFQAQPRMNEKVDYRAAMLTCALDLTKWDADGHRNWNHDIYIDDLPVEMPISLSRDAARRFQANFAEGNAALVRACPTLEARDLDMDETRFPVEGNFERIFQAFEAASFARRSVVRLNAELWLQRSRTRFSQAETHEAHGKLHEANLLLDEAATFLDRARQADLERMRPAVAGFADEIDVMRRRIAGG
ncbi:hypothetical protein [Rhodovulum sp. 12E13]|uniref:hypothetical protein n=1 Tax=Rhodovulum sp. 12E13 TaxID=2203891 RepID=UPI0011C0327A|nr:hypothetical protein [Rhodovulum sp. 12E13]